MNPAERRNPGDLASRARSATPPSAVQRFLATLSPRARTQLACSGVLASTSGLASGAIAAVVHQALAQPDARARLGWIFLSLCGAVVSTRMASEILLLHSTQEALHQLRLGMARRLLATPLGRLQ